MVTEMNEPVTNWKKASVHGCVLIYLYLKAAGSVHPLPAPLPPTPDSEGECPTFLDRVALVITNESYWSDFFNKRIPLEEETLKEFTSYYTEALATAHATTRERILNDLRRMGADSNALQNRLKLLLASYKG